jgi:hypothetical protein
LTKIGIKLELRSRYCILSETERNELLNLTVFNNFNTKYSDNPPSYDNPPTDDLPTDDLPTDDLPTDDPPTDDPPTDNPPTDNPPTRHPLTTTIRRQRQSADIKIQVI